MDHLYSRNFWSTDDSASSFLLGHFHAGSKTADSVLAFYKERIAIEEEYGKRLSSLARKYDLGKNEMDSTFKNSMEALTDETTQLANSHYTQANRIATDVYNPLEEYLTERKSRGKALETGIAKLVKHRRHLESKVELARKKYEAHWIKINNYKTEQILMDETEAYRTQMKVNKMVEQMSVERAEYREMVDEYNNMLDVWKNEWFSCCETLQSMEEEKIKTIKANVWEYANTVSSTCITDDQSCENIRLSLEKCSYRADVSAFVDEFKTGKTMASPIEFIDYAHGSVPQRKGGIQTVDLSSIPKISAQREQRERKKVPPPKPTETQQVQFDLIDRREETFKQLQEEAQQEASQMSQMRTSNATGSEHNSHNVFSDYSDETTASSAHEDPFKQSKQESTYSNPLLHSMLSDRPTEPIRLGKFNIFGKSEQPVNPLEAYLSDLKLGGNGSMSKFRESMQISDEPKLETTNDKRITSITRNSSMRKSKSSTTLKGKFVNQTNLPSRSSEGFPVLKYCRAQYSYTASIEQELSFKKRDILMILHQQPDGWWFAENVNTGDSGLAPSNYLVDM
ncbi:hypothetical protein OGAPHI_007402 [Ogataea philodendri]|uniref:Septation protein imp2 n=1 Tax=Ogataea philodendri TaxID=1378263 RepID=A0A9P8NV36_9ASCO|nr:uncharacterized protein OGAPHI_007402 [Ogataea philodendri]KAH3660197.1 hypothetical protein OGAPHI_007402 [Ogataea philodendri]